MRRNNFVLIFILGYALIMFSYVYLLPDNIKDQVVWKSVVLRDLHANKPTCIKAGFVRKEQVVPKEQYDEILSLIRNAQYVNSNRVGSGPEALKAVIISYPDGSNFTFKYWGAGIFEYQRPFLFEQSRILIEQKKIGTWLDKYAAYTQTIPQS